MNRQTLGETARGNAQRAIPGVFVRALNKGESGVVTEQEVEAAAAVIAASPGIDAPKLPAQCWMGLARAALEAAEKARAVPPARGVGSPREDWHYDSQGYCDNPGRGY